MIRFAVIIFAIVVCALALVSAVGAERPYSCRMLDEAQKKCAANSFGPCYVQHEVDRLRKQCIRDGGRP